jgi:hypothetical protein
MGSTAAAALLASSPGAAGTAALADSAGGAARSSALQLVTVPGRIFRATPDANREHVEGWMTTLVLRSTTAAAARAEKLTVSYRNGDAERVAMSWSGEALRAMDLVAAPAGATPRPGPRFAMRLTSFQPQALGIDRAHCELLATQDGRPVQVTAEFPLEGFTQKTALRFPFQGKGLITQGGALDDGHRNRSGQFAIDAMGLSDLYAVMARTGDSSDSVAGWGRTILAPAAGTVVVARNDRPDQPVLGNSDPRYYADGFADGGDPGNHVVIDHGEGEFSMLAHFQHGSVLVNVGDRVVQGQPLGKLGASGDTSAPHVHHQLQSGPDWTRADALPHQYENGPRRNHDRGALFSAD